MKKAAAMRPPLWVIYCNRFYMGASPGIPPAPPWCGGNTVSAGRAVRIRVVHTAPVSVPHNIGAGRIKGVWRIPTGKGQLVNVFAGQPAPLEIFTSAGVQRGFIAFPAGSEDFSGSGGGVIAADRDILEHGPVKAKILTVGAVDRHVPGAKTGAVKIVGNGGGRGSSRNRFRGGGFAWCCNRCLHGRLRCPPALQERNSE